MRKVQHRAHITRNPPHSSHYSRNRAPVTYPTTESCDWRSSLEVSWHNLRYHESSMTFLYAELISPLAHFFVVDLLVKHTRFEPFPCTVDRMFYWIVK